MDITFSCQKCGQHIAIDEAGAGQLIDCPNCGIPLEVPYKSQPTIKPATPAPAIATPPAQPMKASERPPKPTQSEPRKRRGLATTASVLAGIIVLSVAGVFVVKNRAPAMPQKAAMQKDSAAIAGAKAKLELATQRSDLDGMFLALKELQALDQDSPGIGKQLANVEAGLPLLQKIRVYQADHNHEEVVKAAGRFLELFPEHPDARKALKESGLIFAYLQDALSSFDACFADTGKQIQLVQFKDEEFGEMPDFEKIFYNLDKAEKSLAEAKRLDAQFLPALSLEKLITDTKDSIGYDVSIVLLQFDQKSADSFSRMFNLFDSIMQSSLESSGSSPSDVWSKSIAPIVEEFESKFRGLYGKANDLSTYLNSFKSDDTSDFIQMVKAYHTKTMQLKNSVTHPTGNMLGYRADVSARRSALRDLGTKMETSIPNTHALIENIMGFATIGLKYELFKTPSETKPVLDKYKSFISTSG